MATANIILYKKKVKKDGSHSVALVITHNRTRNYIFFLGYSCTPEYWNHTAGRFNDSKDAKELNKIKDGIKYVKYPDAESHNRTLSVKLEEAKETIQEINRSGKPFTFAEFAIEYKKEIQLLPLDAYFKKWIVKYEQEGKIGNATTYSNTLSALNRFNPRMKLKDVNVMMLKRFETWLRTDKSASTKNKAKTKLKDTSISVYMRTLRALLNKAIADGLFKAENYPFSRNRSEKFKYQVSALKTKTAKRALSKDVIDEIKLLKTSKDSKIRFGQLMFLFSYYTRGMNFIDISFLKWNQIGNERIDYVRRKTKQPFSIPILPQTKKILDQFRNDDSNHSDYVFGILDDSIHTTDRQKHTRVKTVLRDVNKSLKEIAKLIGMEGVKITTYVGRHSYATVLKKANVSTSKISQALGHGTEKITQVYLDDFEQEAIDSEERNIL